MQTGNQKTNTEQVQNDVPPNDANFNSSEFNSLEAVESVYGAEALEIVDCVSAQTVTFDTESGADAANDNFTENNTFTGAEVYSLDCARMAKHDRAQERRSSKSRLTDRRQSARLTANGDIQQDRRAANRAANINAIRDNHTDS